MLRAELPENVVMSTARCRILSRLLALSAILCVVSVWPPTAVAQGCDRACLTGMVTKFVNALVGHDSSTLPLAKPLRYTEDSNDDRLGHGAWQRVTKAGGVRQD